MPPSWPKLPAISRCPPPRGKAGVNTQALGRWLAARKDCPGPFVLREGRRYSGKPARWYVEIGATGTDAAATTEAAVKAMESGDVEPGSMYDRLMAAWESATEKTPAFAAALERAEMRLQDMDLPESLARNRAFWARWMAFASLRAKVRSEGRPVDEALNLWLEAGRPDDVSRPEPGAYGSGATITTRELL